MSESPKRNCPNNTVAIVAWPGLRPAPTSTGTVRRTIPSYNAHTQATSPPNPHFPDTLPSTLITLWIKMKTQKWMSKKREGGKGWEQRGGKTKCLGQDQPGISPYVVPTHRLGLEPSSVSLRSRITSMPRRDHTATKWFHKLIWDAGGKDAGWVSAPLLSFPGVLLSGVVGVLGVDGPCLLG